jgi:pseudouridine kinase
MTAPTLCIGTAHWDLIARSAAPLPRGADVPGRIDRRPGGVALNVALALTALGRPVALVAALGRDPDGDALAALLAEAGVETRGLCRHPGRSDAYLAIEDGCGTLHAAVADCRALEAAGTALLDPLRDGRLAAPWPGGVVADGNLPAAVLARLIAHPATAAAPLALVAASPRKAVALAPLVGLRPMSLYLNRGEAEALCGAVFRDSRGAAEALVARGAAEAIVTDGPAAAAAAGPGATIVLAPPAVAARGATGAGDAFVAAHLDARAGGLDREAALAAALEAAARHIATV